MSQWVLFLGAKLLYGRVYASVNQSVTQSQTHSLTFLLFALYHSKSRLQAILCFTKNVPLLNMFTFDTFSVCYSFSQSGTGVTLFTFWRIAQDYCFHKKIVKYRMYVLFFGISISSTTYTLNYVSEIKLNIFVPKCRRCPFFCLCIWLYDCPYTFLFVCF